MGRKELQYGYGRARAAMGTEAPYLATSTSSGGSSMDIFISNKFIRDLAREQNVRCRVDTGEGERGCRVC